MAKIGTEPWSPSLSRRLWLSVLAVVLSVFAIIATLLITADAGGLNGVATALFKAKTHRTLSFRQLRLHLLSPTPTIEVEGLVIGSPPAITPKDFAHVGHAAIQLQLAPLLVGRLEPVSIVLTDVDLQMVRLGHGRNNYSFGGSGLSAFLRPVRRLSIAPSHVTYDDPERGLTLAAQARYDSAAPMRPLHLDGGGTSHGQPYQVIANGGPLNGRKPGAPYLFDATLRDGRLALEAAGGSQAPFDFRGFDLAIHSTGPNLAEIGYFFNLDAVNSPAFEVTTHTTRIGHVVRFDHLRARIGGSDLTGVFTSDHSQPRRVLSADFRSGLIRAEDVAVLLGPRPSHAAARDTPGVAAPPTKGGGASKPFPVEGLRKLDLMIKLKAARVSGYATPLSEVVAGLQLHQGRMTIKPLSAWAGGGQATATVSIDATGPAPKIDASARLRSARLAALRPSVSAAADGALDASVQLTGEGASPQALLSHARGHATVLLHDGVIQKTKATALGGDLLQAAWLSLVDKSGSTPLRCARADFAVANGIATAQTIDITTALGATSGAGQIDLVQDRTQIILTPRVGSPARTAISPRLQISGPLEHPKVTIDVKRAVSKSGLSGLATILSTPFRSPTPSPQPPTAC